MKRAYISMAETTVQVYVLQSFLNYLDLKEIATLQNWAMGPH